MLNKYLWNFFLPFFLMVDCWATEHVVRGIGMEFKPSVTFAQRGDRIKFVDMVGHDTESIGGMIPTASSGWKSKMSEEGFVVTIDSDGLYVYKCNPHVAVGMFGSIVVGDLDSIFSSLVDAKSNLNKVRIGRNAVKKLLVKATKAVKSKSINRP